MYMTHSRSFTHVVVVVDVFVIAVAATANDRSQFAVKPKVVQGNLRLLRDPHADDDDEMRVAFCTIYTHTITHKRTYIL